MSGKNQQPTLDTRKKCLHKRFALPGLLFLLVLSAFIAPGMSRAGTDDELVRTIMEMRSDIEELYARIDENRENYKANMKSLALQTADAEAQINRKNTTIKLAEVELKKIKNKIAESSSANKDLTPLLKEAFTLQETTVRKGLPFKVEERLSAMNLIRNDLAEGLITPERALALVWAGFEDNLRLTREIGLFKQQIDIDGQVMLANVAKIGTVMLFFSTPDERFGHVANDGSGYTYQFVNDQYQQEAIAMLFDALGKQIRTGYFTIPNGLVQKGGQS